MENTKASTSIHPEIKKTLIRKHIAASSVGLTGLVICTILSFLRWELFKTNETWKDIIMIGAVIIILVLFSSALYMLFNKRGYEAEVSANNKILIPTICVFLDLLCSFIFSVLLIFYQSKSADPTSEILMYAIIGFGVSASLLFVSEFILFHTGGSKYSKIYSED